MSQSSSSGDMGFYSQSPPVAVSTPNRDISHSQTAGTSFDGTYSAGLISNSTSYESNYPNGSRHLISQPSSSPATYSGAYVSNLFKKTIDVINYNRTKLSASFIHSLSASK